MTVTSGTDVLVINKVQVVLAEVELAAASADCVGTSGGTEGECEDIELEPTLLDLPVDGALKTVLLAAVPAGTYAQFQAKIEAVQTGEDGATAFLTANPSFSGVSIRVEGTFNGTPFTFTTNTEGELQLPFDPPMVVDATGLNVTVNVDVSTWFKAASGALINPSTAGTGGANAAVVAQNIRLSFKAFEDDDKDGDEDK